MKYSIIKYPITEKMIKSGVISQTNRTARINNSKTKCIVSYADAFLPKFTSYPSFTIKELQEHLNQLPEEWSLEYKSLTEEINILQRPPVASKKITINGIEKSLFKRVLGVTSVYFNPDNANIPQPEIPPGKTGYVEFTCSFSHALFTGADIIGAEKGDSLDYFILDTANNDYSKFNPLYPHFILNQFGFNVFMSNADSYSNTSEYDASIYAGMVLSCAFKNNGDSNKIIYMNCSLDEVK